MANYYQISPNLTRPFNLSTPFNFLTLSPHMDASNPPDKAFEAIL